MDFALAQVFIQDFELGGEKDGSRMIVVCKTKKHMQGYLGGLGACSPRKILNLHTSQVASDAIWDKIS